MKQDPKVNKIGKFVRDMWNINFFGFISIIANLTFSSIYFEHNVKKLKF